MSAVTSRQTTSQASGAALATTAVLIQSLGDFGFHGEGTPYLYILVIASSTLLLPLGGGFLIAALGNVLYVADVIWAIDTPFTIAVWLQVGVFVTVALGSGYLSVLLRREGEGKAMVVAELLQLQLQADDILRNIRSGVLTVDSDGRLLYANPMAEQMLELDLLSRRGQPIVDEIAMIAPELAMAVRRSITDRATMSPAW